MKEEPGWLMISISEWHVKHTLDQVTLPWASSECSKEAAVGPDVHWKVHKHQWVEIQITQQNKDGHFVSVCDLHNLGIDLLVKKFLRTQVAGEQMSGLVPNSVHCKAGQYIRVSIVSSSQHTANRERHKPSPPRPAQESSPSKAFLGHGMTIKWYRGCYTLKSLTVGLLSRLYLRN